MIVDPKDVGLDDLHRKHVSADAERQGIAIHRDALKISDARDELLRYALRSSERDDSKKEGAQKRYSTPENAGQFATARTNIK